jgi:hypothetical protein
MTNYSVAFDIGGPANLYGGWWLLIIPMAMALGLVLGQFPRGRKAASSTIYWWLVLVFVGSICLILVVRNFAQGERLQQLEAAGNRIIAEGCLKAFHPADHDMHDDESFEIGNDHFSYNEGDEIAGFHHTHAHGGPINADSRLRVVAVDGEIVRLETKDHACAPAPDVLPSDPTKN